MDEKITIPKIGVKEDLKRLCGEIYCDAFKEKLDCMDCAFYSAENFDKFIAQCGL